MAEDEVRDLIRSVARRGTALGVSTLPEEIRHNLSHSRHAGGHRIVTASVLRRRLTAVLVAAVVLTVFFVPVPHVSLFNRLVAPTKSSTVPSTVPSTSSTSPGSSGPRLAGVDGAAAWALSATRLSVSDDGGLDWSRVALPAGLDPAGVTSVVQAPNGELFLAALKGSTVRLYRKESSTSAGWSYATLVPSWSAAATGFAFQTSSVMITPGPTGMVSVVVTDELSHSEAIPRLFVSLDDGATFRQYPTPAAEQSEQVLVVGHLHNAGVRARGLRHRGRRQGSTLPHLRRWEVLDALDDRRIPSKRQRRVRHSLRGGIGHRPPGGHVRERWRRDALAVPEPR